jgi:ABC-type transport system involved in multi-copper enzyme maturation permease subunit
MRAIIRYTIIEILRNRIYLSAFGLVFLLVGVSWLGAKINSNFGVLWMPILSFGLGLTQILVTAIALFLPVFHMALEYERGSAQVLWAKMENRSLYYFGKFCAFWILLVMLIVLAILVLGGLALVSGASWTQVSFLKYFLFGQMLQSACVLSLVFLFYALMRSPVVSSLLALLTIYFGILFETARDIAVQSQDFFLKMFYYALYYGMPNLSYFNFENHIIYQERLSFSYLGVSLLYALCFTGVCLSLSHLIFGRREV